MSLTASDRSALIKLAAGLPVGSEERRAILAGLNRSSTNIGKVGGSVTLPPQFEHMKFTRP